MYIRDGNLFLDKNNVIHFNNLLFLYRNHDNFNLKRYKNSNLKFKFSIVKDSDCDSFRLNINISYLDKSINDPFAFDPYKNLKQNVLLVLNKIVHLIYNILTTNKHKIYGAQSIMFIPAFQREKTQMINNIIVQKHHKQFTPNSTTIFYGDIYGGCNSIIAHITKSSNVHNKNVDKYNKIYTIDNDKFFIRNNNFDIEIKYPYNSEIYITNTIDKRFTLFFSHYYDYIHKRSTDNAIYIDYSTPLHLLYEFFNNLNIFNNIKHFTINNEYDLIKYL